MPTPEDYTTPEYVKNIKFELMSALHLHGYPAGLRLEAAVEAGHHGVFQVKNLYSLQMIVEDLREQRDKQDQEEG